MTSTPQEHWSAFLDGKRRSFRITGEASLGESHAWNRGGIATVPAFSGLLEAATVTPVRVNDTDFELLTWGEGASMRGWLCAPPTTSIDADLYASQRELLGMFGGIAEIFGAERLDGDANAWWVNQVAILSPRALELGRDFADSVEASDWAWEDADLEFTFDAAPYAGVAIEANANMTMVHVDTGAIVAFLPSLAVDGVTTLEGCPEYTLYTLDDAPDFERWLDRLAREWLGVAAG